MFSAVLLLQAVRVIGEAIPTIANSFFMLFDFYINLFSLMIDFPSPLFSFFLPCFGFIFSRKRATGFCWKTFQSALHLHIFKPTNILK
jgi:hypothetical protein